MSLRQALLTQRLGVARPRAMAPLRPLSSSARRNGGHEEHHHAHADNAETHESWFSTPWRNTFIIVALGIVAWPYLPATPKNPASPTLAPEEFNRLKTDPSVPWITRTFASWMEDKDALEARNHQHLKDALALAESKLLVETAERREVSGLRSKLVFDQASPYGVPVGSQVDVSDVRQV